MADHTSQQHRRGLHLRSALVVLLLDSPRALSISELVVLLGRRGVPIDGRPSKVVSDALRWEVKRGRVVQRGRGLYAAGTVARETKSRMRRQLRDLQSEVVAATWDASMDPTLDSSESEDCEYPRARSG